jgi:prolyl-tRNA synthetase
MHSVHVSSADAIHTAKELIELYKNFVNDFLCIPTLIGEKTVGERFAGADNTFTIEALMQDGQGLQCATSHYLGQNFAKTFDVKFQNKANQYEFAYQTSAGMSTRIIGAVIMTHADDKGLVLPIGIAPIQIALLTILSEKEPKVQEVTNRLYQQLRNKYRVSIDNTAAGFGFKIANQEVQGTPITLVIGPKEVQENKVVLIRRDNGIKLSVTLDKINETLTEILPQYQKEIYQKAEQRLNAAIVDVCTLTEFNQAIKAKKIVRAP